MIRLAKYEELAKVSELMLDVFKKKMLSQYSAQGKKIFEKLISLSSLEKRFLSDNLFYIFIEDENIKGVLELEIPCHIAFLFVKEERKGIARKLCQKSLEQTSEEIYTVGAFASAVNFYKKIGFVEVSEERLVNGMCFTLMAKTVKA